MSLQPGVVVVAAGDGRSFWALSDRATFKLTGHQTAESYVLFELVVPPANGASPVMYRHAAQETFYVLDGAFEFCGQGEAQRYTIPAAAGTVLHFPGGAAHGYRNVGLANGRLLVICSPPGLELFYAELDRLPEFASAPDMARVMAIGRKYQVEFL